MIDSTFLARGMDPADIPLWLPAETAPPTELERERASRDTYPGWVGWTANGARTSSAQQTVTQTVRGRERSVCARDTN